MPPLTYSSEELAKRIEANTKKITALQSQFEKLERLMIRITMRY